MHQNRPILTHRSCSRLRKLLYSKQRRGSEVQYVHVNLREDHAQLLIKPFEIILTVTRSPSPMAPDRRKDFQLPNTWTHIGNFILGIFRAKNRSKELACCDGAGRASDLREIKVSLRWKDKGLCFDTLHRLLEVAIVRFLQRTVGALPCLQHHQHVLRVCDGSEYARNDDLGWLMSHLWSRPRSPKILS